MALDFYKLDTKNHSDLLFQVEEEDLLMIKETLDKLKSITGVYIDAYGKTRIHAAHVKLWLELLEKHILNNRNNRGSILSLLVANRISNYIRPVVDCHLGLLVIGD